MSRTLKGEKKNWIPEWKREYMLLKHVLIRTTVWCHCKKWLHHLVQVPLSHSAGDMWHVAEILAHLLELCPPRHYKAPEHTLLTSSIMLFSRSQQDKFFSVITKPGYSLALCYSTGLLLFYSSRNTQHLLLFAASPPHRCAPLSSQGFPGNEVEAVHFPECHTLLCQSKTTDLDCSVLLYRTLVFLHTVQMKLIL